MKPVLTVEMLIDAGVHMSCSRCGGEVDLDDRTDDGEFLCGDCCEELDRSIIFVGREMPSHDCGR